MTHEIMPDFSRPGWTRIYTRDDGDETLGLDKEHLRGCSEYIYVKKSDEYVAEVRVEEIRHHMEYVVLGTVFDRCSHQIASYDGCENGKTPKITVKRPAAFRAEIYSLEESLETMAGANKFGQRLIDLFEQKFFSEKP